MTADQNKEISYIAYNHANMPTHVQMNNGKVLFTYDALGNKWYKRVGDYQHNGKHGTAYIFGMQDGLWSRVTCPAHCVAM